MLGLIQEYNEALLSLNYIITNHMGIRGISKIQQKGETNEKK